jgi:hypothetical protein
MSRATVAESNCALSPLITAYRLLKTTIIGKISFARSLAKDVKVYKIVKDVYARVQYEFKVLGIDNAKYI